MCTLLNVHTHTHTHTRRSYDAWGKRVDELVTSPAWKKLHDISAEEGLIALAYERKHQQWRYVRREAWDIVEGTMHIGGEIFV